MDCGVEPSDICRERTNRLRGRNEFPRGRHLGGGGHDRRDIFSGPKRRVW